MTRQDVTVGYIHNGDSVGYNWFRSMADMDREHVASNVDIYCPGSGSIPAARNQVVETWLKNCTTDWLFWSDTDIGFKPETVTLLREAALDRHASVMSGVYHGLRGASPDGRNGYRMMVGPVAYRWDVPTDGFKPLRSTDLKMGEAKSLRLDDWLIPVDAVGMGCVLIHRSAYESVSSQDPIWHSLLPHGLPGQYYSEDLSFFLRLLQRRASVMVHTGVLCNHKKTTWL